MFFHLSLLNKKDPLHYAWQAGNHAPRLPRAQLLAADVKSMAQRLQAPPVPLSLRVSGICLEGVAVIHCLQATSLLRACTDAQQSIAESGARRCWPAAGDAVLAGAVTLLVPLARASAITLPDVDASAMLRAAELWGQPVTTDDDDEQPKRASVQQMMHYIDEDDIERSLSPGAASPVRRTSVLNGLDDFSLMDDSLLGLDSSQPVSFAFDDDDNNERRSTAVRPAFIEQIIEALAVDAQQQQQRSVKRRRRAETPRQPPAAAPGSVLPSKKYQAWQANSQEIVVSRPVPVAPDAPPLDCAHWLNSAGVAAPLADVWASAVAARLPCAADAEQQTGSLSADPSLLLLPDDNAALARDGDASTLDWPDLPDLPDPFERMRRQSDAASLSLLDPTQLLNNNDDDDEAEEVHFRRNDDDTSLAVDSSASSTFVDLLGRQQHFDPLGSQSPLASPTEPAAQRSEEESRAQRFLAYLVELADGRAELTFQEALNPTGGADSQPSRRTAVRSFYALLCLASQTKLRVFQQHGGAVVIAL